MIVGMDRAELAAFVEVLIARWTTELAGYERGFREGVDEELRAINLASADVCHRFLYDLQQLALHVAGGHE